MKVPTDAPPIPAAFLEILTSLRHAEISPVVHMTEVPGPARLAPFTAALSGGLVVPNDDDETVHGRLVVLFDPAGQPSWQGRCRIVVMARSDLEPDIGSDPFIHEVAWSWLTDSLATFGRTPLALAGTVTRTLSSSFAGLAERGEEATVELRASWTLPGDNAGPDLEAWARLLELMGGLPPLPEGVTALRAHM